MKKLFAVITTISVLWTTTSFAGVFGTINPVKEKEVKVGVDYSYSKNEFKSNTEDFDNFDANQNQVALTGEYSITDKVTIEAKVGVADMVIEKAFEGYPDLGLAEKDFEGDFKPYGTLGAKALLFEKNHVSIGAFMQGSYYSAYKDNRSTSMSWEEPIWVGSYLYIVDIGLEAKEEIKVKNMWETNIGMLIQLNLNNEKVKSIFYAGPFLYISRADVELTQSGIVSGSAMGFTYSESFSDTYTADYEEDQNVGAVVGANIDLSKGFLINGEAQFRSEPSFGLKITKSF